MSDAVPSAPLAAFTTPVRVMPPAFVPFLATTAVNRTAVLVDPNAAKVLAPAANAGAASDAVPAGNGAAIPFMPARPIAVTALPDPKDAQILRVAPEFTSRWQDVRVLDPDIIGHLHFPRPGSGVPRSQLTVPVSEVAEPTDMTVFENAADPATTYTLPRYGVANSMDSGVKQPQVKLSRTQDGGTLTVHLTKEPLPAGAVELKHDVAVILSNTVMGGGRNELVFDAPTQETDTLRAVLTLDSPSRLQEVFTLMTDRAAGAELTVRRVITVAVPAPVRAEVGDGSDDDGEPRFLVVTRSLDANVEPDPFVYSREVFPTIFEDVTGITSGSLTYQPYTVDHEGNAYTYYRDPFAPRTTFYYLPDSFKIARSPDAPHEPLLSITYDTGGGSLDDVKATVDYVALPYVDPTRLLAAATALQTQIPELAGAGGPTFEPLLSNPDKTQLLLSLPGTSGFAATHATVDLRTGIRDSFTLSIGQFQPVFAAMFSATSMLFTGSVTIDLSPSSAPPIPFAARMDDLLGPVVALTTSAGDDPSTQVVSEVKNVIESPVTIDRLPAQLKRGDTIAQAIVSGPQLPYVLAPGASASFTLSAGSPLPGSDELVAIVDVSHVRATPDQNALLAVMTDPTVPAQYTEQITVQAVPQVFGPRTDDPDRQIVAVVVDFEAGDSVQLDATTTRVQATLRLPIANYLLQSTASRDYRYKLRLIRAGADQTVDTDWRTDHTTALWLPVSRNS